MAIKLFNHLYFLLIAFIGHATSDTNSPHFAFIKKLQGLQKGNNTKGIINLKTYLNKFGYLENLQETNNDDFDDILESAIKTYQENYNIKPTGIIDPDTVSQMTAARCGCPDIINGFNTSQARKTHVPHYSFAIQRTWPPSKRNLRYRYLGNFPEEAKLPVKLAFERWASVAKFSFREAGKGEKAELSIGFYRGDHGDGTPFDGPGNVLAHAFPPPDGRFHYDLEEKWFYLFRTNDAFDLWSLAIHEIGHLLGLQHTSVKEAVMFAYFNPGETKDLHPDDIQQIHALYG